MKCYRIISVLVIAGVLAGSLYFAASAAAQSGQLKPEDSQIFTSVEMNCINTKLQLTHTHESDGLLRVTMGQTFDAIGTKLMARMNTRIVQNKLDGTLLIRDSADFDKALSAFRTDYKAYENSMSDLLQLSCEGNEQTFYIHLQTVRQLRAVVNNDVTELNTIIGRYKDNFVKFRRDTEKERSNESN